MINIKINALGCSEKDFYFFFLILFTWYMAAMYRLQSLMALAVAEIILLFLLFFLTRYLKKI